MNEELDRTPSKTDTDQKRAQKGKNYKEEMDAEAILADLSALRDLKWSGGKKVRFAPKIIKA